MKKQILLFIVLILSVLVVGCEDKKFTDKTVNVIFFTATNQGGSEVMPYLDLEPGTKIEKPEDPERKGYVFGGWYKDINYTSEWDFDKDVLGNTSIVLYAKWEVLISKITYDLNGGEFPNTNIPYEYKSGERVVLPTPTRKGYQFLGWYLYDWDEDDPYTKPGDTGYRAISENSVGDLHFHAHWKVISSVVTFEVNFPVEGEGPDKPIQKTLKYGDVINFETLPDTAGYRFIGWNQRADGTGTWYNNGDIFERTQRTTVYAIWEKI